MIVLDENIPDSQRQLLERRRIRLKQIGQDFARQGLKDKGDVVPLLLSLRSAVLFTSDLGFYKRRLRHKRYGLVCLDVKDTEIATSIRRFLRHPDFNTKAKRMGKVVRLSPKKIHYWSLNAEKETVLNWKEP